MTPPNTIMQLTQEEVWVMIGKCYPEEFKIEEVNKLQAVAIRLERLLSGWELWQVSLHNWNKKYGDANSQQQMVADLMGRVEAVKRWTVLGNREAKHVKRGPWIHWALLRFLCLVYRTKDRWVKEDKRLFGHIEQYCTESNFAYGYRISSRT